MELNTGDMVSYRRASETERRNATVVSAENGSIVLRTAGDAAVDEGQMVVVSSADSDCYCEVVTAASGTVTLSRRWCERREYFRVDDIFPVNVAKIDRQGQQPLKTKVVCGYEGVPPAEEPDDLSVPPRVWKMLCEINAKLALILERLQLQEEGFASAEEKAVNISATGMRFLARQQVAVDELVELKLLLPTSPPMGVVAYGRVVRVEYAGNDEYEIAVHFSDMEENVRDEIIQYTLMRQRELLRKKKRHGSG